MSEKLGCEGVCSFTAAFPEPFQKERLTSTGSNYKMLNLEFFSDKI